MHGDTRYPVEVAFDSARPLPSVRAALIDPFKCYSCFGHGHAPGSRAPCPTCGGEREAAELRVDLAVSTPYASGCRSVIARVRSPWPGRDGWHIPSREGEDGMGRGVVWRVFHDRDGLGRAALRAAAEALGRHDHIARELAFEGELPEVKP